MKSMDEIVGYIKKDISTEYDSGLKSTKNTKEYFKPEILTYDMGCRNCTY